MSDGHTAKDILRVIKTIGRVFAEERCLTVFKACGYVAARCAHTVKMDRDDFDAFMAAAWEVGHPDWKPGEGGAVLGDFKITGKGGDA